MPELPEVEAVRSAMERRLLGKKIVRVSTSNKRLREPLPKTRLRALKGSRFQAARRRGKYLLLDLDSDQTLLVHLGMTGKLVFRPRGANHDHVVFELDTGPPLIFNDPRRFGLILVLNPDELETCPYLVRLGVEPLSHAFNTRYLREQCCKRNRPIKNLIMDGHIVVGVGNIYAAEALFKAGIRPTTAANRIDPESISRLVQAIKKILRAAIRQGDIPFAVYGRSGEKCTVCNTPIERIVLGGRSTFYCKKCQK